MWGQVGHMGEVAGSGMNQPTMWCGHIGDVAAELERAVSSHARGIGDHSDREYI